MITTLEKENDILIQNTKLDLISKYLEVLDKLKLRSKTDNNNKESWYKYIYIYIFIMLYKSFWWN